MQAVVIGKNDKRKGLAFRYVVVMQDETGLVVIKTTNDEAEADRLAALINVALTTLK